MKSLFEQIFVYLAAVLFLTSTSVEAQQLVRVPRVGYLSGGSLSSLESRIEAFRQGTGGRLCRRKEHRH